MLAVIDGEVRAGPGGPSGPAAPPTVAWVLWDRGQVICSQDGDDPLIAAWQATARGLVTPRCPLLTLVVRRGA
jgi:hypothetical protein